MHLPPGSQPLRPLLGLHSTFNCLLGRREDFEGNHLEHYPIEYSQPWAQRGACHGDTPDPPLTPRVCQGIHGESEPPPLRCTHGATLNCSGFDPDLPPWLRGPQVADTAQQLIYRNPERDWHPQYQQTDKRLIQSSRQYEQQAPSSNKPTHIPLSTTRTHTRGVTRACPAKPVADTPQREAKTGVASTPPRTPQAALPEPSPVGFTLRGTTAFWQRQKGVQP